MELVRRQVEQPWLHDTGPLPLIVALLIAFAVAGPGRRWLLGRLSAAMLKRHGRTEFVVFGRAMASMVVTTASFVLAGILAFAGIAASIRLLPETVALAFLAFAGIFLSGLGLGVGSALRSPDAKDLRPLRLPAGLGHALGIYPAVAGAMLGGAALIDQCSRLLGACQTSWALAPGILVAGEALVIARFLVLAGQARERLTALPESGDAPVPAVFGVTILAWLALAVAFGALLTGRTRFAMLLLQWLLWAGLAVAVARLTTGFVDALVASLLGSGRRAGQFATRVVGVRQERLAQTALLITAAANVVIWLFTALLILAPLQGEGGSVAERVRPTPMVDALRAMHLSPKTLAVAAAVLFGGIAAIRIARGWLDRRFLPSTNLDAGARNSIVTGLGYLGIIVALLATSSTLALQLEKITLIASALTVGIGFGMQAIIQNFVSGVILLFERPIKLGDWVSVSGSEGRVRRMRVRATEVVGDDGTIAIVLNSAFISSTVLNRSNAMDRSSFDLTIRISDAPSAQAARDLVAEKIAECDAVRQHPEPRFYLEAIGDRSWTFRVRMQPAEDVAQARITSDLLSHLSSLSEAGVRTAVE